MYRRLSSIMFPIVALLLIGSVYWGYQEHQDKNAILIKAENQYQRAFHDLTFHVEKLHDQLGNTLAVHSASTGSHRKALVNVWRLTSQAQNEISQLPLSYLPFTEAEDFLSHISNFAYKTSVRDMTKQPLSDGEFKTLQTLYEKSDEISKDLQRMQQDVLKNNLRWMDVEVAIASDAKAGHNTIVDGLRSVEGKVDGYPEMDWGPSVSSLYQKRTIKMLSGNKVGPEEVQKKAAELLGGTASDITVQENGKGTDFESYTAVAFPDDPNRKVQMDFTSHGGQITSLMKTRELGGNKISFEQAKASADKFLEEHGFKDMRAVTYDIYQNAGTFTYVSSQNGVLIYPDKLTVKVALDNGETVGLQASDYVYEHRNRELPSPIMTKEEARKTINPDLKVTKEQLALIDGEMGEEVLCYEYTGSINGTIYRIYINAENGVEEKVEKMSKEDRKAAANS
ncbi:germination protein YpeB [Paenibacillus sp. 1011MAR3C5]|uniref:germination protein YpeB n=1 Tax=Paenibacillus sp. 1011MAR3C5 TaxID=1675787 RepID=UPI000E6CE48C|nr:germination protein YpeB [Paenibacillus sp. 1011MAR3C5]RJE90016.1 germination protein YpeB [Paenibacillus sp. 1011MAR3C5]